MAPQAQSAEEDGDLGSAESLYHRVMKLDPSDPAAGLNLGNLLRFQSRVVEAEAAYRWAVRADPNFSPAWHNLADLLDESGRLIEAVDCERRALAGDPQYDDAMFNLALFLQRGVDACVRDVFLLIFATTLYFSRPLVSLLGTSVTILILCAFGRFVPDAALRDFLSNPIAVEFCFGLFLAYLLRQWPKLSSAARPLWMPGLVLLVIAPLTAMTRFDRARLRRRLPARCPPALKP